MDGQVFTIGSKLPFEDANGRKLLRIEQKLFAWGKTFEIQRGDEVIALVKKKVFTFLRARFTVDVPGPEDLEAEGRLLDGGYVFTRHGRRVAEVRYFEPIPCIMGSRRNT